MKDRRQTEAEEEDAEALLSDSEKDWEHQRGNRSGWLTAVSFIISVSFAMIGGVILGRYVFLDKNSVCTAHVSQNSTWCIEATCPANGGISAASQSDRSFV